MSLFDKVSVNTHYTRSVNLERDASSVNVVKSYIPTSRSLRTFAKISDTFHHDQAPRAWSLVGPYGSGKSSFSVFLSELLSDPVSESAQIAKEILTAADEQLGSRFDEETAKTSGYLKVLITGSPEPLGKRIAAGFAVAAEKHWQERKERKPTVISRLHKAAKSDSISTSALLNLIQLLQSQLARTKTPGILLVIDELGKFLEYEARHYGANDIYMLQALAEHACQGSETNLLMFVLLHQSFEQYAKGLGESLKNEWSKVQGRFEEIPFLESAEQVLRVVSAALDQSFTKKERKDVLSFVSKCLEGLKKLDALPGALTAQEAKDLFVSCYPLHPVSALLLPHLCQKVAQNERTLFSYLGSHEDFGMMAMLEKFESTEDYILPHHIYEYFINNQPAVVGDYLTHRRWAEVVTAVERLGDAKPEEVQLLKSTGILNIVGSKGGFKAAKELLATTMPTQARFDGAAKALIKKSVITYRKFNNEYRVWQGSDFDLEAALDEELANVGNFSLAAELNNAKGLLPVVARRYTIKNGALRYFEPYFIDAQNYNSFERQGAEPRILFFLSGGQDDEKLFLEEVAKYFSELDLVVLCLSGNQLRDAVAETQALQRVQVNRQELHSDPIAKREFEDRLTAAEQSQASLLQALVDSPELNSWFHQGQNKQVSTKRALQGLMSHVLEAAYHQAPLIHNELVNRDNPSAQANAARNKLLLAMLERESEADLGIEKFPPEKAIYRSLLKATGIHRHQEDGSWAFVEPEKDKRKQTKVFRESNILPAWQRIDAFLDSTEEEAKSFSELNKELMAPPFGVKAGVLPILYIAVYSVYQHELALYENRRYKPFFTKEMLERFVKRPDEFTFQRFRIEGLKASVFDQYSKVIHGDTKKRNILDLAKPLATFMGTLPEYTRNTRRGISPVAIQVRMAFDLAKSPQRLLLQDLPKALGFDELQEKATEKQLSEFSLKLTEVLREFRDAYPNLLEKQKQLLAQAFNIDANLELSELRTVVSGKCHGLENFTVDTQGLRAFIMRLNKKGDDDKAWFENVLMLLGHKPSQKWLDSDQDTAEHRLNDFARRVVDLEQLSLYSQKKGAEIDSDFDVYLLRSVKKGGEFLDEVVAVDVRTAKAIDGTKAELSEVLGQLSDKELKLAALAELVDEFLNDYRESQKTPSTAKPTTKQSKSASTMSAKQSSSKSK